ncbi:hypothetical protein [Gimesia algae]|uniref:Uncharacterized protein n=1 Tax=Gimesia algae TaxID=2527971 RepID=A0A517V894_9PLAN|nr:hypothetical protein [Gimesia algae]QDT89209.1 hypothetical protein Pan161_08360 [Gimesia algae]
MKSWSVHLTMIVVLLCLMAGSLQSAVEAEKPILDADLDVKKMLKRIEQLEQRVRELEQKPNPLRFPVTQMPSPPRIHLPQSGTPRVIPTLPQKPAIPPNWRRNQINGIEYYIVPLSQSDRTVVR